MDMLMEEYELQYAGMTAEITSKISLLTNHAVGDRGKLMVDIDRYIEETQEVLEQMELEIRDLPSSIRPRYKMRLDSYKTELGRLCKEFVKAKTPLQFDNSNTFDEYNGDSLNLQEEQRQRLLNNSERLERSGNQLKAGYRLVLETEEIGANILQDLHSQRETIERSRNRLRETDADLTRSTRTLSSMISLSLQNKFILFLIAAIFLAVIIITIYYRF